MSSKIEKLQQEIMENRAQAFQLRAELDAQFGVADKNLELLKQMTAQREIPLNPLLEHLVLSL